MRRIYESSPLTLPEGYYLGGEERNTVFLHRIFCPLFSIEFGGNFKYTDNLVLFVQTTDCNQSMRFPNNMVLFVEWHCSSHVILPLFWFFLAFKGHNCGLAGCLNVPSDRWLGQMIDESSNQRLSPVDSWTTQTINSFPNGVISLSLRKFR